MKPSTLLLTAAVVVSNVAGNYALSWGMKHAPADAGPIVSLFEELETKFTPGSVDRSVSFFNLVCNFLK